MNKTAIDGHIDQCLAIYLDVILNKDNGEIWLTQFKNSVKKILPNASDAELLYVLTSCSNLVVSHMANCEVLIESIKTIQRAIDSLDSKEFQALV